MTNMGIQHGTTMVTVGSLLRLQSSVDLRLIVTDWRGSQSRAYAVAKFLRLAGRSAQVARGGWSWATTRYGDGDGPQNCHGNLLTKRLLMNTSA